MDWRERLSLRFLVLPLASQRWRRSKQALGTPLAGGGAADAGIVSIPDLSYRARRIEVQAIGRSPYRIAIRPNGAYSAPSLGGLWVSAPYLNKRLCAYLSAMLSLDERPQRFMRRAVGVVLRSSPTTSDSCRQVQARRKRQFAIGRDCKKRGLGGHFSA